MGQQAGLILLPLLIFLGYFVSPSMQYFTYSDCGVDCMNRKLPCVMLHTLGNNFSPLCLPENICEDRADDDTPFIYEDKATIGGVESWPAFKNKRIPPKPIPRNIVECEAWKIASIMQIILLAPVVMIFIIRKLKRFHDR